MALHGSYGSRQRGITLFQVILLVAGLLTIVLLLVREYRKAEYASIEQAMMTDLRTYATVQEIVHQEQGSYARGLVEMGGFEFSEGVLVEYSSGDRQSWSLQIIHEKRAITCSAGSSAEDETSSCWPTQVAPELVVPNRRPVAAFELMPARVTAGTNVTFDAGMSRDPEGLIARYHWDFGDGTTAMGVRVPHTYEEPGTYTAQLIVVDDEGSEGQMDIEVSVLPPGGSTEEGDSGAGQGGER